MDDNTPQTSPKSVQTPEREGKKKSRLIYILVATISLILITAAAAYYFYTNNSVQKTATKSKYIDKLTVGMGGEVFDLGYPAAETALTPGQVSTNAQVYEGLVRYEELSKVKPLLATNWTNPQGATDTWDFTLKQGVKFHTGRTMTADDVKYSIEAMAASGTESFSTYGSTIKDVTVLAPNKVRITTEGSDPLLLNKLTGVYIVDSKSDKKNDPINGTGPFTATKGAKQTESKLDLTAFDDYHGQKSYVKRLIFKNYDDYDAVAAAIKKKEVDIGGDIPNDMLSPFKGSSFKTIVDESPVSLYFGFMVNKPNSPVNKKEVREAIQIALDRDAFFKETEFSGEVINQLIPKQIPGYDPTIQPITRDVEKAKTLLKSAGYPNGITIDLYHFSNINEDALKSLRESAAEANITIKTINFPDEERYTETVENNVPDMALLGWASSVNDGIDFFDPGVTSSTGVNDPAFTALYTAAQSEFDTEKRLKLLQEASRYVSDNVLVLPAYSKDYYVISTQPDYVYTQDITGLTFSFYYSKTYRK